MANILAIDTSTSACSVALSYSGNIQEDFRLVPQSHTQCLLPMVDQMLAGHQLSLRQLDAIALTTGPGSFTGLRIGLGVVQGLAFGADLPVISVSTLRIMFNSARRLLAPVSQQWIVPCLDARMQEVYWACFRNADDLPNIAVVADSVMAPTLMISQLQALDGHLLGVGDGWACVPENERQDFMVCPEFYPHAYDVAVLAQSELAAGNEQNAVSVQPVYIRNEVSWKKRQKIRGGDYETGSKTS